jgi:hypothetical protein
VVVPDPQSWLAGGMTTRRYSSGQLVEQHLRLFQIERVEAFGEPAVDRSEKLAGLLLLALVAPEPRARAQAPYQLRVAS